MGSVRPRVFCKLLRDLCTNRTIRYNDKGDQGVVVLNMEYVPELLVLAETLSYTETARRLHMSHSAVSRHVDAVERALGARLFNRTTRKVELTDAGRAVIADFSAMQAHYTHVLDELGRLAEDVPVIRLSCPDFWIPCYLEPLLAFLSLEQSALRVKLESNPPVVGLSAVEEGWCDLAFGIGLPTELKPPMNMRLFLRERIVATIHEDNALAGCETLALEQLAGEPLVVLDDRAEGFSRMNEEILRFFTQRGCAPCDIRRTEQIETLGLKLSECKGYALTPASLQFPHRDYLRAIPPEEEDISFPLCFFFRTDRLSPALTRFFEYAEQFVLLSGERAGDLATAPSSANRAILDGY